jgi:hypothetical protein
MSSTPFSAAPSLLGYLYQCDLALLELLRRMTTSPSVTVSIELLDDVAFEAEGRPDELLQAKHHLNNAGSLADASTDVWKSLRVWADGHGSMTDDSLLVLVSTAVASDGSAMSLLRGARREPERAREILERVARTSTNDAHKDFYATFLKLTDSERKHLIDRVVVADAQPTIGDLAPHFERALRLAALPQHRGPFAERLRQWWYARAVKHLLGVAAGEQDTIASEEVDRQLAELRDQFTSGNLPIDFGDLPGPSDDEAEADARLFVEQLRLIMLGNKAIRLAIRDHNRAFAQRSKWMREELLDYGELARFESNLVDEWEHVFTPLTDLDEEIGDADAASAGRQTFDTANKTITTIRIRPRCAAPYVTRGSLHMLADDLKIGWHPDWIARLQHLLPGRESAA